jgi:multisubunit Na+/H+ antiporter MnhE subunit
VVKSAYAYTVVALLLLSIYLLYTGAVSVTEIVLGLIVSLTVAYINSSRSRSYFYK